MQPTGHANACPMINSAQSGITGPPASDFALLHPGYGSSLRREPLHVIASDRVGANPSTSLRAKRLVRRSSKSQSGSNPALAPRKRKLDCFVALLLAMTS